MARADGSRRVELFIPFEFRGVTIDAVTFRAARLDDTLAWESGAVADTMALLSRLSGLNQETLGQLRYPDADRVIGEFMAHLPETVRSAIVSGERPIRQTERPSEEPIAAAEEAPAYSDQEHEVLRTGETNVPIGADGMPERTKNFPFPDVPGAELGMDLSDERHKRGTGI